LQRPQRGARNGKSSRLDRLPLYQTGEIYDTWKVSRESESHSAPAGGVSAYALPFLAKMAMMADRSDKSIDRYLLGMATHSADEFIGLSAPEVRYSARPYRLAALSQRDIAGSRVAWLTAGS
jgi:hypothetical protein